MKDKLKRLRARLKALEARAAGKLAEIKDDTAAEAARAIEAEHAEIVGEIETVRGEIAEAERAVADEEAAEAANANRREEAGAAARAVTILDLGERAGMDLSAVREAIAANVTVEEFRQRAFDHMASRDNASRISNARVTHDEQDTIRSARIEALSYSFGAPRPQDGPSAAARQFMDHGIVSLAMHCTGERNYPHSAAAKDELIQRAAMTTSDFPLIMGSAINRTLEARYALATPTYRRIARQRNFRDFRAHTSLKTGDFPMLEKVAEDGAIKFGKLSEGKETLYCYSYAKALALTRQVLINDDLGAIMDMLADYGQTVALFEEVTFYATALNATLADAKTVFHSGHANLAVSGGAISVDTVAAGRTAMAQQKSLDGNPLLANAPAILLCGPTTITDAEKLVASITPATVSNVNIFSGRLEPLSTAQITGNAWHLLPDPATGCNYRWGYLEGAAGPRVRVEEPFGRQGMAMSVELDFGCGATDYRYGYKNPGA